jgi:5'-3' exonuclease
MSILIDFSQIAISNLFANIGYGHKASQELPDVSATPGTPGTKTIINEDLIRHMVLNSLRMYHMKFGEKYGPLVVCADNRHYWRKDIFPYYKASRKKTRDNSGLDWHLIFDSLNKIRDEIAAFTPYRVINVNLAEADDLIGVIAKKEHTAEKILILSGDHDFQQLQKYKNIEQYAPIQKKFMTTENPIEFLREHIMVGDAGDGIPNFKSPDNTFVAGLRQTSISKKDLARWIKEPKPENFCDIKMLSGYKRNQQLIDLDFIPKDLQKTIVELWETPYKESRKNLLNYFIKFKLSLLLDHIGEF